VAAVDLDALIPGYLAAHLVGVSRQLVRKWTKRTTNPLTVAAHDAAGRPLFRVRDVIAIERECRRSTKSSRNVQLAA
jgi:hypothetical protein